MSRRSDRKGITICGVVPARPEIVGGPRRADLTRRAIPKTAMA